MLTKEQAKGFILKEWQKLPEAERKSKLEAHIFATKIVRQYPFQYKGNEITLITGWIEEHERHSGRILEDN